MPLVARGRGLGTLSLVAATPGRFGADDLALAEELGRRCALAIDNARLYRDARAAEERYRDLFEGVSDAVVVFDAEGRFIDANPAAVALFGVPREELLTRRVGDARSGGEEGARAFADLVARGEWHRRLEMTRPDGTRVPVEIRTTAVRLPDETVYASVMRDVSEQVERERLQQEFVGMVAHEMRTPLTALRGYLDLMRRRGGYSARHMEIVAEQAKRLNRLLNDTLEVSRLEARRLELRPREMDLRDLLRRCVEEARETGGGHPIRLELPDRPLVGIWDPDRVEQIVQNLLTNALKYSPEGGEVAVRAVDRGDHAEVTVTDRGIGVPQADLPHLFDPFYRATNARSAGGMGLGLYISKGLVEAHGGTMGVRSTLGEGSMFTFTLPYSDPPARA